MRISDWSSDVCSSDLRVVDAGAAGLSRGTCAAIAAAYQSRQNRGLSMTRRVRNSSLPSSMPADSSHFAASGRVEQLPAGPMTGPRPGPTLASAVAAPLTELGDGHGWGRGWQYV